MLTEVATKLRGGGWQAYFQTRPLRGTVLHLSLSSSSPQTDNYNVDRAEKVPKP